MSERSALAAVFLALAATRAPAQGTRVEVRALAQRVDTVVARWRTAQASLQAWDDSVARARARMDTVRSGSLQLFVESSLRGRVEPAARVAMARVEAAVGAASRRLGNRWLVVRQLRDTTPDSVVVAVIANSNAGETHQLWGKPDDDLLARWIEQNALHAIAGQIDDGFRRWLYGELLPDTTPTAMWLHIRLDLVSSDASVARQCYAGDLRGCSVALRLTDVADPVTEWYDAAGRRHLVAFRWENNRSDRQRSDWEGARECIDGDDAACQAFMRTWRQYGDPVPPGQRLSLAKLAVQMGGAGGYERILSATGAPAQRIEAAAGVPLDSVLHTWRRKVRDSRLPSQDFSASIAAMSFGWILALGALSLRSSRWR